MTRHDSRRWFGRSSPSPPNEAIEMTRCVVALIATFFSCILSAAGRAQDPVATTILDTAIKAMGGEEKLSKVSAFSWTGTGMTKSNGRPTEINAVMTFNGLNRVRREFGSESAILLIVLDGDKGWFRLRTGFRPMDGNAIAKEKRNIYLQVIPSLLVPLKGHGFHYAAAGEEEVGGKPASILNVTGPDGKDFKLYFDKESGLPVKEVARSIFNDGREQIETTTFARYKDFEGIKKATEIEVRSGPQNVSYIEITDFKVLDDVKSDIFAGPK
jgi:zinc protease